MAHDTRIITAEMRHVDSLASCHSRAFSGQFLTLLGPSFLRRFYAYYIRNSEGIVKAAVDEHDNVVGLVCGGKPELHNGFSKRCVPLYAFSILFAAVRYPLVRRRLIFHIAGVAGRFRGKKKMPERQRVYPLGRWSSLLSIGVDPAARGQGIGRRLMMEFLLESKHRGYQQIRLSVHLDNDSAIALYSNCGWKEVYRNENGIYFVKTLEEYP